MTKISLQKIKLCLKKMCLAVLVWTVVSTSFNNGILCINATALYKNAQFPWYEWQNYLFLSLFLTITPVLLLYFLKSVYVRRFLRFFLLIMSFNKVTKKSELFLGPFSHFELIFTHQRPFTNIYLIFEFAGQIFCFLFLLRQIRGKSFLPIPVTTNRKGIQFHKNLKMFVQGNTSFDSSTKRKIARFTVIFNVIIFSGIFATLTQENSTITLERPEGHKMEVNFWAGNANYSNETLKELAEHNSAIYGWIDFQDIQRFSEFGIRCFRYRGIPRKEDDNRTLYFEQLKTELDYLDSLSENHTSSFQGYVTDFEGFRSLALYNESYYQSVIEYHAEIIQYINSRGYEYLIVETMHSVGDLYDGDSDIDVVYNNPFHPVYYENASAINWMVYRSEIAMPYDEPHEYFTFQWATHINNYMKYLEKNYDYPEGYWQNRSQMSIGVPKEELFTYNSELRGYEVSLEEFIQDVKIAHACKIGGISTFSFNGIMDQWGLEGLRTIYDELDSYETVSFLYKRRATYFGNLKWAINLNGSVFGLFYSDGFYSSWFNIISLVSLAGIVLTILVYAHKKIKDESFYGKKPQKKEEILKRDKGDENLESSQSSNRRIKNESKKSDNPTIMVVFRASLIILTCLIFVWTFVVAEIFFFSKEIVLWSEYYWKNSALDDEQFSEFWSSFIDGPAQIVLGLIIAVPLLMYILVKVIDRKKTTKL